MKDLKNFILEGNSEDIFFIEFSKYLHDEKIDDINDADIQATASVDTKKHIITFNDKMYFYFFNGQNKNDRDGFIEYEVEDVIRAARKMAGIEDKSEDEMFDFYDMDEASVELIDYMQDVESGSESTGNSDADNILKIISIIYTTILEKETQFTFVQINDSYKKAIDWYNKEYKEQYNY